MMRQCHKLMSAEQGTPEPIARLHLLETRTEADLLQLLDALHHIVTLPDGFQYAPGDRKGPRLHLVCLWGAPPEFLAELAVRRVAGRREGRQRSPG